MVQDLKPSTGLPALVMPSMVLNSSPVAKPCATRLSRLSISLIIKSESKIASSGTKATVALESVLSLQQHCKPARRFAHFAPRCCPYGRDPWDRPTSALERQPNAASRRIWGRVQTGGIRPHFAIQVRRPSSQKLPFIRATFLTEVHWRCAKIAGHGV